MIYPNLVCPKCNSKNIVQRTRTISLWWLGIIGFPVGACGTLFLLAFVLPSNINGLTQWVLIGSGGFGVGFIAILLATLISRHTKTYYECLNCHYEI